MKRASFCLALAAGLFLVLSMQDAIGEKITKNEAQNQVSPGEAPKPLESVVVSASGAQAQAVEPAEQELRIRGMKTDKSNSGEILALKIDQLANALARNYADANKEILIASFVDMDRLNRTNSFGRYMAEELTGKMNELGFKVVELRASKRVMSQPNIGTHVLLEDSYEAANFKPSVVLSGTYKKAGDVLTVHARLVSHASQKVLSTASLEIKVEKDDQFMQDMMENSLERVGRATGRTGK